MGSQYRVHKKEQYGFDQQLCAETNLLEQWFSERVFSEGLSQAGSEIEFFLLDKHYNPAQANLDFIALVNEPSLIPEIHSAQLEINSHHVDLSGDFLTVLHRNILETWQKCCRVAEQNNYHIALIGALPTANIKDYQDQHLTPKERYKIFAHYIKKYREEQSFSMHGYEALECKQYSTNLDGVAASFQLHLQTGFSESVRYYNITQVIAAPMLALACNSPFLYGHYISSESRIQLMEETLHVPRFDWMHQEECSLFGNRYVDTSFFELFQQNALFHPHLYPKMCRAAPIETMQHVRRQNSVVHRWNRPVLDFNPDASPHLRIEHRPMSSGPTVIDMIANAAFFYGICKYYAMRSEIIEQQLAFCHAKHNFFNAVRYGLEAPFTWFNGQSIQAVELLMQLIPLAKHGLEHLNVPKADIQYYLGIIEHRVKTKRTGSAWQCQFINKYGRDFHHLMAEYIQNQYQESPVSEWRI